MASSRLISLFLLVSSVFWPLCVTLKEGNYYHLRNIAENSYLRVETGGVLCKSVGPVSTSSSLNATSVAYRWRYREIPGYLTWLNMDSNGELLQINELTMDPQEPYCYHSQRNVTVIPVSGSVYRVQNGKNETCLMSNGVGSSISWTNCDAKNVSQQWEFIDA